MRTSRFPSAISLAVFVGLARCTSDTETAVSDERLRPVRTVTVANAQQMREQAFVGVLDAARDAELAFRLAGKLTKLPVRACEDVSAGDLIAQLDQTDYQIQLKAAQADFERASSAFRRGEAMMAKQLIAAADFDQLKADNAAAEAALARARQDLANTTVRAPFAGVVAKRHVENYTEIANGTPVVTLSDLSSLVVRIDIPESIMIRAGRYPQPPELVALIDGSPEPYPLTLKEVSTEADAETQTYRVTLSMPMSESVNLLPGMSATVQARRTASLSEAESLIFLPPSSALEDASGRTGAPASAARTGCGIGVGCRGDTYRAEAMSPPVFVVDTNAVVAGLVTGSSRSPVALVLDAMLSGTPVFLLSPTLLDEYRSVLSRPKLVKLHGLTEAQIDELLVELTANAIWRESKPDSPAPDRGDDYLGALFSAYPGTLLVTGDRSLLEDPPKTSSVIPPSTWLNDFVSSGGRER